MCAGVWFALFHTKLGTLIASNDLLATNQMVFVLGVMADWCLIQLMGIVSLLVWYWPLSYYKYFSPLFYLPNCSMLLGFSRQGTLSAPGENRWCFVTYRSNFSS